MSAEKPDALERVAGAVSDGTPVDWKGEMAARPELSDALTRLSQLEKVREAHGGVGSSPDPVSTRSEQGADPGAPSLAPSTAPALFLWGPLRVLEKLGEGSGGDVYRAYDSTLETEIALKLRKPDAIRDRHATADFLSEGRKLARVRHRNVLIVHGVDEYDGRMGIWTEFVRGKSLEEYLEASGPLSAREATLIGIDLCSALAAVHAAKLVHCDVKTRNVMREEGGRIILMDFGSMGEIRTEGSGGGRGAGTPIAMAPEQLRGEEPKPAVDIYGLGVLLYRMVSGRYPIEANSRAELFQKHLRGERVALRDRRADLPAEFVAVVERALAPDARQRYSSAGEMERGLAATIGAPTGRAIEQENGVENLWRRVLRTASLAGIVLLVALLVLFAQHPEGIEDWFRDWNPFNRKDGVTSIVTPPSQPEPPLTVTAGLFRRAHSKDEPIPRSGGRVAPGDKLWMEIHGNEPMHVYILNEDDAGRLYALFPLTGAVPRNPLDADKAHRLPGQMGDSLIYWTVTSAGGRESIVAVASRMPLSELDSLIALAPHASPGQPVQVSPMALHSLRGIGGIAKEGTATPETRRRLQDAIDGLTRRANEKGDVWVWETHLENPTP